jgi:hypothetical protein
VGHMLRIYDGSAPAGVCIPWYSGPKAPLVLDPNDGAGADRIGVRSGAQRENVGTLAWALAFSPFCHQKPVHPG